MCATAVMVKALFNPIHSLVGSFSSILKTGSTSMSTDMCWVSDDMHEYMGELPWPHFTVRDALHDGAFRSGLRGSRLVGVHRTLSFDRYF